MFWEGVIFLALSVGGARRRIVDAIPPGLKTAIGCGIGLFIAFIGLKSGGMIVANEATFVRLGDFRQPAVWLVLLGIVLTAVLVGRNVRGGIVLAVLVLAVAGLFIPALPADLPPECRTVSRRLLSPLEAMERDAIVRSLIDWDGNKIKAAGSLGMSRATIYRKIHEYGIVAPTS